MSEGPLRTIAIVGDGAEAWTAAALLARALRGRIRLALVGGGGGGADGRSLLIAGPAIQTLGRLLDIDADRLAATGTAAPWLAELRDRSAGHTLVPSAAPGWGMPGLSFAEAWMRLFASGQALAAPATFSREGEAARAGRYAAGQGLRAGLVLSPGEWAALARARALAGGVEAVGGTVADAEMADGQIAALRLEDGRRIAADFFIDASGPSATLIGRMPDSRWESWGAHLPGDRVTHLRLPAGEALPLILRTRQEGVARSLAVRVGDEERIAVVSPGDLPAPMVARLAAGREPLSAVTEPFAPGRRSPWIGNVLALGQAAMHLGPEDARSLERVGGGVMRLLSLLPDRAHAPVLAADYARAAVREDEACRDLLLLGAAADAPERMPDTLRRRIARYRAAGLLPEASDLIEPGTWFMALHASVGPPDDAPGLRADRRAAAATELGRLAREVASRVAALPHFGPERRGR